MFRKLFRRKKDETKPSAPTPKDEATTEESAPGEESSDPETVPTEEAAKPGFFQRLKAGLAKTRASLTSQLGDLLRIGRKIDDDLFDSLEEVLIRADVGVETTLHLVEAIREESKRRGLKDASELEALLKEEILHILGEEPHPLDINGGKPYVLLVVGVNGVGKTTTIGKLAARYKSEGRRVLVAAGDTFRAAAVEQLEIWCQRAGVDLIKQGEGADAAAVVYDALHAAKARHVDLLIVDTAGRLHTKKNLMQELGKIGRVAGREIEGAPHEVLLVLDATTGQNAVLQAREFSEIVPVTGIALTKLDSTAKGGIVIAVKNETGVPVKLIGIGESIDDLRDFAPRDFVDALFDRSENA